MNLLKADRPRPIDAVVDYFGERRKPDLPRDAGIRVRSDLVVDARSRDAVTCGGYRASAS